MGQRSEPCLEGFNLPAPINDAGAVGCRRVCMMNGVELVQLTDSAERLWGTFFTRNHRAEGPFRRYYPNGKVYRSGIAADGMVEGTLVSYWPNGKVQRKDPFIAGRQNGTQYFYDSLRQMLAELTFVDDSREGIGKWYHGESMLKEESAWFHGYKYDRAFAYDLAGNLIVLEFNGLDCSGKPCLEYAIHWDENGVPLDSSGRAVEAGDAAVDERIRACGHCPSVPVRKEALRYLLGTSCD